MHCVVKLICQWKVPTVQVQRCTWKQMGFQLSVKENAALV